LVEQADTLMGFDLDPAYKQVPERIADFKAKHPDGSLQEYRPWQLIEVGDQTYIAYTAAAYRTPDDPRPGIGTAWEAVPGKTPYTKLSELQNAETSAWGRAIVAALASESKSVASAEDIRNRQADHDVPAAVDTEKQCEFCPEPLGNGKPFYALGGGKYAHKACKKANPAPSAGASAEAQSSDAGVDGVGLPAEPDAVTPKNTDGKLPA
jgi:hypothetical protein